MSSLGHTDSPHLRSVSTPCQSICEVSMASASRTSPRDSTFPQLTTSAPTSIPDVSMASGSPRSLASNEPFTFSFPNPFSHIPSRNHDGSSLRKRVRLSYPTSSERLSNDALSISSISVGDRLLTPIAEVVAETDENPTSGHNTSSTHQIPFSQSFSSALSADSYEFSEPLQLAVAPASRYPPFQHWAAYLNSTQGIEALTFWIGAVKLRAEFKALVPHVLPSFENSVSQLLGDVFHLKDELSMLEQKMDRLRTLTKCELCPDNGPLKSPVMISCGHIFCGACLRNKFRQQFQVRIRKLLERQLTPHVGDLICAILPFESHEQLHRYMDKMAETYTETDLWTVLNYACPKCKEEIVRQPVYYPGLDYTSSIINDVPIGANPEHMFDGLFLA